MVENGNIASEQFISSIHWACHCQPNTKWFISEYDVKVLQL